MTTIKLFRTLNQILLNSTKKSFNFRKSNVSAIVKPVTSQSHHIHTQTTSLVQSKVSVDNLQINFDRVGDGPHPVLCMPGALGCIDTDFDPILHRFNTSKFTMITWDPPGCGKSRPPDRDFSGGSQYYHRDANWSRNLMKTLGYNKYSILGWSDGATTAVIKSSKYPESLNKLVLWGGRYFITSNDVKQYKMVQNIDNWSAGMKAPMIKTYGEAYFRRCWWDGTEMNCEIFHKNAGDICKQELQKITSPTLIIHGKKDVMVGVKQAEYAKENIKGSRLHIIPEGPHHLHIMCADEFVPMVEKFLDESSDA